MKITDIKQQVKRADRYSVYVDGKYVFSLSEAELLNTGIKKNQEFSDNELDALKNTAVLDKAYDRTLNLISHRLRSEWELRDYLKRKGYDEAIASDVISKLVERGYVDDAKFAQRWVENRRLLKPTSKRRLAQELKQKRINEEIIKVTLDADDGDESQILKEIIEQKRRQTKYQDDLKLMQYLARQGFDYSSIKTALQADSDD